MITDSDVFDAVRRGYNDLGAESNAEIINYFSEVDAGSISGHTSHIKGILFEQEYVELLAESGVSADLFDATNHPVTDITIPGDFGVVNELQLKATDSVSYVNATITEYPDIDVVVTSEVAASFDPSQVIDSGIEEQALEEAVSEALFGEAVNPVSPISVIGWLLGFPF